MRISKIKLAGFKSFVDPTTLNLPGNLTGIVGPNGCGKSNIIDAVNWVMGETSAKHLRGDSMVDVIFTGSNTRQPVGNAFVEVIFDNSDGVIGGQYAGFGEISIKRQVDREGISVYQLNGTRCRRKDITNLFLGTGLGSRSYSVIEQGMITRVIEAKPEDLRIFLEEAAGISKYKERRRETENRIRHTNDNISRLNDIREELAKQLTHLERQSRAAERYQQLKQQERALKAEYIALKWRGVHGEAQAAERLKAERENGTQQTLAELRETEKDITKLRDEQSGATDHFNEIQSAYYRIGSEISRLEQAIQHAQDRRRQLDKDLAQAQRTESESKQHISGEERGSGELQGQIEAAEPRLAQAEAAEREASAALEECEQSMQRWQADWDEVNRRASDSSNTEQIERTRLEYYEQDLEEAHQRIASLRRELDALDPESLERQVRELAREVEISIGNRERLSAQQEHRRQRERELQTLIESTAKAVHGAQDAYQTVHARLASLEALQQASMGEARDAVLAWLNSQGLSDAPRIAAELSVEPGWERAVEAAIRLPLDALRVDSLRATIGRAQSLPGGALSLFEAAAAQAGERAERRLDAPLLIEKVKAPWPVGVVLGGTYAVETLADAMDLSERLRGQETVVTRDGVVLGRGWMRMQPPAGSAGGVLGREQELRELHAEAGAQEKRLEILNWRLEVYRKERLALSETSEQRAVIKAAEERAAALRSSLAELSARLKHELASRDRIEQELSELEDQASLDRDGLIAARDRLHAVKADAGTLEGERERMLARRDRIRAELQRARDAWRHARDEVHAITLHVETMRSRKAAVDQSLERHRDLLAQAGERCLELQRIIEAAEAPISHNRSELESALRERLEIETRLGSARHRLEAIDGGLRKLEQDRITVEQNLQQRREELEKARLEARALEVRLQDLEEQIRDSGADFNGLLEALDPERSEAMCAEDLARMERRIQRLGPINLAAIDEFNQLSERKEYLDKQHGDLNEALDTLQNAMRKIDRETRNRFKETFDKVNTHLQRIFPILFGGGHAYMEMAGGDLLETGVTVMARPPGKRNSTIHLLSGGEKALTALALVFSIFELNPAPFCLLDEVDAPLDDLNVVRFCDLVNSMAHAVQFVFVTHNKITMEIAQQLIGVTMQEPGVSRLVAVDMDEAVDLAASA